MKISRPLYYALLITTLVTWAVLIAAVVVWVTN